MKRPFTAVTRPRTSSGVPSCTSVMRITTLTMSEAPSTASAASATTKLFDSANTTVESPKPATAANIILPAPRSIGQRVSTSAIVERADAGRGAQQAERPRAGREHVAREHRQQRGHAAEQHGEQIERDDAEDRRTAADEGEAREEGRSVIGSRDGAARSMRIISGEQRRRGEQREAGAVHDRGTGRVEKAAERRAGDGRDLIGAGRARDRARHQRQRHQARHHDLHHGHLEGARDAEDEGDAEDQLARDRAGEDARSAGSRPRPPR